jgi:hypothetical protein
LNGEVADYEIKVKIVSSSVESKAACMKILSTLISIPKHLAVVFFKASDLA